jgi:hypothetical protein
VFFSSSLLRADLRGREKRALVAVDDARIAGDGEGRGGADVIGAAADAELDRPGSIMTSPVLPV